VKTLPRKKETEELKNQSADHIQKKVQESITKTRKKMSSTFLSGKNKQNYKLQTDPQKKKQLVMKKYVHIRARGPPTLSRKEGTEKHSILFQ
jgi:hypothetical protein